MNDIVSFLSELIQIKSLSGEEKSALDFVSHFLKENDFLVSEMPVQGNTYNIYSQVGTPKICFTSHLDVVPALDYQFFTRIEGEKIIGRGACDAKGQVAAMVFAALELKAKGYSDFSLLFVVGEETDGIGAKTAARVLKNSNLKYVVNGEPTECKLVTAHKGAIMFEITTSGKSVHSGYPERGIDANNLLLDIAADLRKIDFGFDEILGQSTINIGRIDAGVASNVISSKGVITGVVRTVLDNYTVVSKISNVVGDRAILKIIGDSPKVEMKTLPGFETDIVSYCTDIPHLKPIAPEFLLYGPGSIFQAHTNHEFILVSELNKAVEDLQKIYHALAD